MNRPYRVRVATFAAFASPEVWLTGLEEWKAYVQAYRLVRRILAHRRKAGRGCDYTYEGPGGGRWGTRTGHYWKIFDRPRHRDREIYVMVEAEERP